MRNGIAAVLIVKDEEKLLARCLSSLEGIDQLVVLDTGSSDRTVEIAKSFTSDIVLLRPALIPFHFAQARNNALALAKQDWALSIDADEVLLPGSLEALRKAFWRFPAASAFNIKFVLYDEEGENPSPIPKLRVFRRNDWIWQYRIHEVLVPKRTPVAVKELPEAVIEHRPDRDKAARRAQNLELLKISVLESPEHARNARQLGIELFHRDEWKEALAQFKIYLEAGPENRLERSEAETLSGRCHSQMGRLDEALKSFDRAVEAAPERREPHFYRASALIKARRLEPAIASLEACLAIPEASKPDFYLNRNDIWDGSMPREAIAFCRAQLEEAKAKFARRQAGSDRLGTD
jgi:glycosyltransferase involved in cell wall biosynthesis